MTEQEAKMFAQLLAQRARAAAWMRETDKIALMRSVGSDAGAAAAKLEPHILGPLRRELMQAREEISEPFVNGFLFGVLEVLASWSTGGSTGGQ